MTGRSRLCATITATQSVLKLPLTKCSGKSLMNEVLLGENSTNQPIKMHFLNMNLEAHSDWINLNSAGWWSVQTKDEKIPAPAMVAGQLNNQAGQMLETYLDMKNLFRNHRIQDHTVLLWMSTLANAKKNRHKYRFLHIPQDPGLTLLQPSLKKKPGSATHLIHLDSTVEALEDSVFLVQLRYAFGIIWTAEIAACVLHRLFVLHSLSASLKISPLS